MGRNYHLSGNFFGTAGGGGGGGGGAGGGGGGGGGYALFHDTTSSPADTLDRSIHPDFRESATNELVSKLATTSKSLCSRICPAGGSWVSAFFLVGLLIPFRNRSWAASAAFSC